VKYFVGLIQEKGPAACNTRFPRKLLTCRTFCFSETENPALTDPSHFVQSTHPEVSGSGCGVSAMTSGVNFSDYSVK
jgi:hypothetical protein